MEKRVRIRAGGDISIPWLGEICKEPREFDYDPEVFRKAASRFVTYGRSLRFEFVAGGDPSGFEPSKELAEAHAATESAADALKAAEALREERAADLAKAKVACAEAESQFAASGDGKEWAAVEAARKAVEQATLRSEVTSQAIDAAAADLESKRAAEDPLRLRDLEEFASKISTSRLRSASAKVEKAARSVEAAFKELEAAAKESQDALWALAAARSRLGVEQHYNFAFYDPENIVSRAAPNDLVVRRIVRALLPREN